MNNPPYKTYLGDGVYADFDGYHIVLTTENGIETTNRICLEEQVINALADYAERIADKLAAEMEPEPKEEAP